ncbi:hypothetical protein HPB50_023449 [Hyalomma asiaticum]|uniref:Uncharacterized protein n=1 Tax=Hyalomma asiaticum TaxID=266040 RepID=A0ACB7TMW7_HYAAI|nr:hypothetical protein HPB50_023449 [Hyalomma asiaticum]
MDDVEAAEPPPSRQGTERTLGGFCSRFCRGLYLLFMLALFGAAVAVLVLWTPPTPTQVFLGAVLFALGGCCGLVFVSWDSVVRSTRLGCCCIYATSVVFCAGLLGAGSVLAERTPRYVREDGLVLLGLGLLGLLFVALYALAGRRAAERSRQERGSFLGQLTSRSRLSSSSAAVELCKSLFTENRAFAPQRLQEDEAGTNKVVMLCVLHSDADGAKTVTFVEPTAEETKGSNSPAPVAQDSEYVSDAESLKDADSLTSSQSPAASETLPSTSSAKHESSEPPVA